MPRAQSEYEVEDIFIDKLTTMGYDYVQLNNYDDVIKNFRIQLCKLNEKVLKEAKGEAKLQSSIKLCFDWTVIPFMNQPRY